VKTWKEQFCLSFAVMAESDFAIKPHHSACDLRSWLLRVLLLGIDI
jgi:hypothetical protein